METELQAIIREHIEAMLVDIAGTSLADTKVAMQLVRSAMRRGCWAAARS